MATAPPRIGVVLTWEKPAALIMAANMSPIISPEWVLIHEVAAGALIGGQQALQCIGGLARQ